MNFSELNVLNAKQLEKQVKVLDGRLTELQGEIRELEKMRTACLILLGSPVDFAPPPAPAEAARSASPEGRPAKAKKAAPAKAEKAPEVAESEEGDLPEAISGVLKDHPDGLSADDIFDALKDRGIVAGKNAVGRVYSTLESYPDRFVETHDGAWKRLGEGASASA